MKKHTIIAVSALLAGTLFIGSTPTMADGVFAAGPYLGVSGLIHARKEEASDRFPNFLDPNVVRPFAGYRFNKHIAVEMGYDYINRYSYTCFPSNNATCSFSMQGADAAVIFSQPLGNRVNLYVKGGAALMKTKMTAWDNVEQDQINENVVLPEVGGGIDYYFTKHIALGATANYMFAHKNTPWVFSTGLRLSYTF